ncbi:MAG: hypothetical protein ACM3XZ_04480 [Betaproteobacteria bacterium]
MRLPATDWLRPWHLMRRLAKRAEDRVAVRLPGLELHVERAHPPSPAELTVVIPRAEFRARLTSADGGQATFEVVLNSITAAHSPRYPPEAGTRLPFPPNRESGTAGI